ncbi:MAG: acetyl-CoA carboxylase carboxyltransferase subunit alpha [Alphaproteobacteria bacterium]
MHFLDFEKPIAELEGKLKELRRLQESGELSLDDEIKRIETKIAQELVTTYAKLSPRQKVQVARHPDRPHAIDYINGLIEDFTPLAGDRLFGEDEAIIGGLGRFDGRSVVVIGQEKGSDTESRIKHNFGMARPEGYRKAQRLLNMASRFGLPVLTIVDTAGAFPGRGAEERGQAEAIAKSIETCLRCETPIISVVIGEGGSGGAIAIATADKVMMLEHAVYSVISPEGCASILWRSADQAGDAAAAMKLTAQDLKRNGICDKVIAEPEGGAHRAREQAIEAVGAALTAALSELDGEQGPALRAKRREKFLAMGTGNA